MWHGSHVEGQHNRNFSQRISMKIEFSSQRREMLLFLTSWPLTWLSWCHVQPSNTFNVQCNIEERLWELTNWSPKGNTLIFYWILPTNFLWKCTAEISLKNFFVDVGALKGWKTRCNTIRTFVIQQDANIKWPGAMDWKFSFSYCITSTFTHPRIIGLSFCDNAS